MFAVRYVHLSRGMLRDACAPLRSGAENTQK